MLSEEGWTKSKNWARRLLLVAVFAGFAGVATTGLASLVGTRLAWSDLERHYLPSYLWAASPSVFSSTGAYSVVVVGNPSGREYLATPEDVLSRDGNFAVTAAAQNRGVAVVSERHYSDVPHAEAYWKLREHVYGGQSAWQLFRIPRFIGLLVFAGLFLAGILRDHTDRQAKKAGLVEQGPQLVTPERFTRTYSGDGIGLEVKSKSASGTVHIRIPKSYESQSVVVLGDTGSGKTVALKQMIDQIADRGDLAVIHDPKADYLPSYFSSKRGDVVLNPFDARCPFWNPADEMSSLHDIETIANAFFPDVPGKEPFWTESPRKLMTIFLSKKLSAAEMVRLFENEKGLDKLIAGSKYASVIDPRAPSQRNGVISELSKLAQVLQWLPREEETANRWSALRWTTNPCGWLFLTSRADQATALQTLYAIWLELLISRCLAKRFSKRLWFVIDELPVLRHIPNLQKLMTLGRECNVPLIIGLQGRAQLDERYGPNGAEVILSQPVTKLFLRTSEPKAAKWISDSIGSQAIERIREGVTAGVQDWRDAVNYTPERRIDPAVLDSVIASLPNLRGYLKFLEHIVEIEYEPKDRPEKAEAIILRPVKPQQDRSETLPRATASEPVAVHADAAQETPKPKLRFIG